MKIICIPGLGGHKNIFRYYAKEFPEHQMEFVQLINWHKAQEEVAHMIDASDEVILLCNCYGAQIALRAMYTRMEKVKALIIIEPFFFEFTPWFKFPFVFAQILYFLKKITDHFGWRRKKYSKTIEYSSVELQPLCLQPLYDIQHQSLTDYFAKLIDIGTFRLPEKIETKTLFIFSPRGFTRDPIKREKIKKVFVNADVEELGENSHNIATLSRVKLAEAIKKWIEKKVLA